MKTYSKIIQTPQLVIEYDNAIESPRKDDGNIGYFFTKEDRYKSPDGNIHPLYEIMLETADEAENTNYHIERMKKRASELFAKSSPKNGNSHNEDLHIIEIHPIYRYEHGDVIYKRGTFKGFDYSNCGFYFITAQSISGQTETSASIAKSIDNELSIYSQWANGEVFAFTLYDEKGEIIESCGNFYDIEDIREYLPKGWEKEDLNEYFK